MLLVFQYYTEANNSEVRSFKTALASSFILQILISKSGFLEKWRFERNKTFQKKKKFYPAQFNFYKKKVLCLSSLLNT